MRGFFLTVAVGLLIAVGCGAALTWDGSGYLYQLLDNRTPFVVHGRYITVLLHWPTLLAAMFTDNVGVLQTIFGLLYASVPFVALALSWWIVREQAPALFVWPVLGIGLAMLPGQIFFVAEANLALQLFWPLLLAVLLRVQTRHVPALIGLSLALALSHPFAIALLLLAALVALFASRAPADRRKMRIWAAAFTLLALLNFALLSRASDPYAADQLAPQVLTNAFGTALVGLPLLALAAVWLVALLLALAARRAAPQRWLGLAARAGLLLAGAALLLWARDISLWRNALDYRFVTVLTSSPLLALAIWEGLRATAQLQVDGPAWQVRRPLVPLVGALFALVLTVQSVSWFALTGRLRDTIAASPWACLSSGPLGWVAQTPLNHWSIATTALLLQGKTPQTLVLSGDGCGAAERAADLRLTPWLAPRWEGGWFDLAALRGALVGELEYAQGCTYTLSSGWHQTETDGPYWWRWTDGQRARLRVNTQTALTATITGQVETLRAPNQIAVLVNGSQQQTIDLTKPQLQTLSPLTLQLQPGVNQVDLVSGQPASMTQGRPLAFSVAGLTLSSGTPATVCRFHP